MHAGNSRYIPIKSSNLSGIVTLIVELGQCLSFRC